MSPLPLATAAVALALLVAGCNGGDASPVVSTHDAEIAFQAEGITLINSRLFHEEDNLDLTAAYAAIDASDALMLSVIVFKSEEAAVRYASEDGNPLPQSGKVIRRKNVVVFLAWEMPDGKEEAARRALSNL